MNTCLIFPPKSAQILVSVIRYPIFELHLLHGSKTELDQTQEDSPSPLVSS